MRVGATLGSRLFIHTAASSVKVIPDVVGNRNKDRDEQPQCCNLVGLKSGDSVLSAEEVIERLERRVERLAGDEGGPVIIPTSEDVVAAFILLGLEGSCQRQGRGVRSLFDLQCSLVGRSKVCVASVTLVFIPISPLPHSASSDASEDGQCHQHDQEYDEDLDQHVGIFH